MALAIHRQEDLVQVPFVAWLGASTFQPIRVVLPKPQTPLADGLMGDVDPALRMFHMCWALSDGSSKLIPIDEQPNHQIVHLFRLGKTDRAAHSPFNPGPEIAVFALDFLRILLAHVMLLGIDVPLVGSPAVRGKLRDAKGLQKLL
jgi:hypothetical protein